MSNDSGILLNGLDGSNPLGFLAALGTLRTLSLALPKEVVKLSWEQHEGAWRPRVFSRYASQSEVLESILQHFSETSTADHPAMVWSAWMSKDADRVRSQFVVASTADSRRAAFTSAIGSDAAPPTEEDGLLDNPFRAARTDYFVKNLAAIIARCNLLHLERALFRRWDYGDAMENQSLRLDATEDRRHAYQWTAPTLDDSRKKRGTMLGANRLAIEAYDFFQSCMSNRTLATIAFGRREKERRSLRWPIWRHPCTAEVVCSLLGLRTLWQESECLSIEELRLMGIGSVIECQRIKVGDSNPRTNFSPSRVLF